MIGTLLSSGIQVEPSQSEDLVIGQRFYTKYIVAEEGLQFQTTDSFAGPANIITGIALVLQGKVLVEFEHDIIQAFLSLRGSNDLNVQEQTEQVTLIVIGDGGVVGVLIGAVILDPGIIAGFSH